MDAGETEGGEISHRNFTARFAAAGAVPLWTAACTAGSDNRAQSPGETTSPTPGARRWTMALERGWPDGGDSRAAFRRRTDAGGV